jgi:hypothetical protein
MIVYHFTSAEHGISNIANKRIKVAEIDKLNDPFELMAVDTTSDRRLRKALKEMKVDLAKGYGITCFSKKWGNPVHWAHYGDRHRGVALGFEIPVRLLMPVNYVKNKLLVSRETMLDPSLNESVMRKILSTKFDHWSYEEEWRGFCRFSEEKKFRRSVGLPIFQEFSDELRLKEVILGLHISKDNELKIQKALAEFESRVELVKSRAAFRTFDVVPNKSWHPKTLKP